MNTLTIPTADSPAADRVAFGARELDREELGWYQKIDVERLKMADPYRCILGQLKGDYESGIDEFDWDDYEAEVRGLVSLCDDEWTCNHREVYQELDRLWKAEISTRLAADKDNA